MDNFNLNQLDDDDLNESPFTISTSSPIKRNNIDDYFKNINDKIENKFLSYTSDPNSIRRVIYGSCPICFKLDKDIIHIKSCTNRHKINTKDLILELKATKRIFVTNVKHKKNKKTQSVKPVKEHRNGIKLYDDSYRVNFIQKNISELTIINNRLKVASDENLPLIWTLSYLKNDLNDYFSKDFQQYIHEPLY